MSVDSFPKNSQNINASASPESQMNENYRSIDFAFCAAVDPDTTTGLTFGYLGGRWGGTAIASGTLSLTGGGSPSVFNYVVLNRATKAISVSTATTNWSNFADYARIYRIETTASAIASNGVQDHRAGPGGLFGSRAIIQLACSDESTELVAGTALTFRMPHAMTLGAVRASLTTATSGSPTVTITVDINESGSTILSTKLTIDHGEETSTTAAVPAVISDTALADDAEITIDIDVAGGGAKGLKVTLIGIEA